MKIPPCRGFCKHIKSQSYIFSHNYFTSVTVKMIGKMIGKRVSVAVTSHSIDVHIYTENS